MLPKEAGGGRQHPRMFLKASLKCWSQKGRGKGKHKSLVQASSTASKCSREYLQQQR